jgi:hypothetical protein
MAHPSNWVLVCVFGVACALTGCDGALSVVGVIRDWDGRPIPRARVRLQNSDERAAPDGCFSIFEIVAPRPHKLDLRVDADGYAPLRTLIDSPGQADVQVTLAKTPDTTRSRLQLAPSGCKAR